MNINEIVNVFITNFNLKKGSIDWKSLPKSVKLASARKDIVMAILREASKETECEEKCKVISVGSESITSDLDITVTGKKAIDIAELFEAKFKKLFNDSPQKVFDTNVYATSFIFQPYEPNYKVIKAKEKTIYFIDNKGKDERDQHLFAIVKIIENANAQQMNIIEDKIPKDILKDSVAKLRELKNNNKDYVRELNKVKKLQKSFESAEGTNKLKLGILLKNQISVANFNSDEAYYTQGAFFHVVGKLQSGYKFLPITKSEYIDSILENTGFFIENYNKFGIYKKKYLDRISDAFKNINVKFSLKSNKISDVGIILSSILSKIPF